MIALTHRARGRVLSLTSGQQESLKWAAVVVMVLDHVGAVLLPGVIELRLLGRVAFPVFAFLIAYNMARRGVPGARYVGPLSLIGLASILPHTLALGGWPLNIFGTLLAGVLAVELLTGGVRARWVPLVVLAVGALALVSEYGPLGVLLVVAFYVALLGVAPLSWGLVCVLLALVNGSMVMAVPAVGALAVIALASSSPIELPRMPRWFWYAFYPGHLTLLWLVTFAP